jgi:hypothetical protein
MQKVAERRSRYRLFKSSGPPKNKRHSEHLVFMHSLRGRGSVLDKVLTCLAAGRV